MHREISMSDHQTCEKLSNIISHHGHTTSNYSTCKWIKHKVGEVIEQLRFPYIAGGNVRLFNHFVKVLW